LYPLFSCSSFETIQTFLSPTIKMQLPSIFWTFWLPIHPLIHSWKQKCVDSDLTSEEVDELALIDHDEIMSRLTLKQEVKLTARVKKCQVLQVYNLICISCNDSWVLLCSLLPSAYDSKPLQCCCGEPQHWSACEILLFTL